MRKSVLIALLCICLAPSINPRAQEASPPAEKQILFVCTGNYYRSRYAEALFNQKARELHLGWKAVSRGLQIMPGRGGISPVAMQELSKRGVPEDLCKGDPQS